MPYVYDKCFDDILLDYHFINPEAREDVYIQAMSFSKSSVSIESIYGTYIMTLITTTGSIIISAIHGQESTSTVLNKIITLLRDPRFSVYNNTLTLSVCSDSISAFFEKFPVVTASYLSDLIVQRFSEYGLYKDEDTIYQAELIEELVNNESMLDAWYHSHFDTIRDRCDYFNEHLTHTQLFNKIIFFSINLPDEQSSYIYKAASKMNVTFLMFLISCRHESSLNSNDFARQMQNACLTMLHNAYFDDEYKAQRISEFLYKMNGSFGHVRGFRKNLSVFFNGEIRKYCSANPHFVYFMNNKDITTSYFIPARLLFNSSYRNNLTEQRTTERRQPVIDPLLLEELLAEQIEQRRKLSNSPRSAFS